MSSWGDSFFLTISAYLNYYGISFIVDYYSALASRNLGNIILFFAKVYAKIGGGEEWHTATLRHSLSGIFITLALLFRATTPIMKRNCKNQFFLLVSEILLYIGAILIVLMSLSRTSMLVLLATISWFLFINIVSGKIKLNSAFLVIMIFLPFLVFLIFYEPKFISLIMIGMIGGRFLDTTKGYEGRLDMYQEAMNFIDQHVFLGFGFGEESQGHIIHNFLLNAWFQVGIVGFILATLLYAAVLVFWIQQIIRLVIRPHLWVIGIAPEPVMALPILPLIRLMVGGAPFQTVIEWFPLSMFLGFALANERTVRQQNLQRRSMHSMTR
jgi:O-antigen ligase